MQRARLASEWNRRTVEQESGALWARKWNPEVPRRATGTFGRLRDLRRPALSRFFRMSVLGFGGIGLNSAFMVSSSFRGRSVRSLFFVQLGASGRIFCKRPAFRSREGGSSCASAIRNRKLTHAHRMHGWAWHPARAVGALLFESPNRVARCSACSVVPPAADDCVAVVSGQFSVVPPLLRRTCGR